MPSLVAVWYSALCYGYDITTLPHSVLYTYTGDSETPEVYHTAQWTLRGHLRQSHIQASQAFYVPTLIRGILWENIDYFILIIVGEDVRVRGGDVGEWMGGEWHRGMGSIPLTGDSHHYWFLVRPQAEFIGISIS